eukprot:365094-Chlamydomonas_euryale.AAC.9
MGYRATACPAPAAARLHACVRMKGHRSGACYLHGLSCDGVPSTRSSTPACMRSDEGASFRGLLSAWVVAR